MTRTIAIPQRILLVVAAGLALSALMPAMVDAQGIAANVDKPDITAQIGQLQQQVLDLQGRIEKFEKEEKKKKEEKKPEEIKWYDPEDPIDTDISKHVIGAAKKAEKAAAAAAKAAAAAMEKRMANLERAAAENAGKKAGKRADPDGDDESMTVRAPFVVLDDAGRTIFRVDIAPDRNLPRAVVGNLVGARVELGPGANGSSVKVFNATGKAVAGVLAEPEGGTVVLTGPAGGKSAVSLSVESTGGKVRVFPAAGGSARAELIADGSSGAMTVFGADGTAAAGVESARTGAGRFVIANAAGQTAVELGVLSDGRGMVKAGPAGFGAAGIVGGLLPASSIQGRK